MGIHEFGSHGVCRGVDVEVVEDGGFEVVGGEDDGGEGEGARSDEGDAGRVGVVLGEEVGFEAAEFEVVGVVWE